MCCLQAATIERRSMPPSGYITHTVSAPSLHGKTPEELTLLLIQLRRHQAKMASARQHTLTQLQRLNGPKDLYHNHLLSTTASTTASITASTSPLLTSGSSTMSHVGHAGLSAPLGPYNNQADDTYMQLKKDMQYLDLKVARSQTLKDTTKPVKVAESDVDVKLSRLCEQDKILKDLEARISSLKEDKDKLESVLDVSHQQMEQYQEQPAHAQKIAYQQRLLQEDLVTIRAQISRLSTEMAEAWEEYSRLEKSVEQLRTVLQAHMNHSATPQNPAPAVPSHAAGIQPPPRSSIPSPASQTLPHSAAPKWANDSAPPRPPLPRLYDYEDTPPVVPPLPKEASVIRHMSVRGLKRQSDERKRDRESGQCVVNGDCKSDLRSYLSEPELPGMIRHGAGSDADHQCFPDKDLSGSSSQLNQSNSISSFVTLRRGPGSAAARVSQRH
ncbi:hypothetical protein LDENG_00174760, partial [Lucifuga dentata]